MSNKRIKEIKNLTPDELKSKVRSFEHDLFDQRVKLATGQLANPSLIWKTRKDLARVKTILSQKGNK